MFRVKTSDTLEILVSTVSLGCVKNFVDTEVAAGSLLRMGIGLTGDDSEANVMLINTCAFIESARAESFEALDYAVAWKALVPGRKIVVAGCLVEWKGFAEVKKRYPQVDLWTRVDSVAAMGEKILGLFTGKKNTEPKGKPTYLYDDKTDRLLLTPGHYGYLKICDGCNNCCTYCAIPSIRGDLRSRTEKSVVREARSLLDNGVKELIVIAQDIGAFGMDRGEKDSLAKLVEKLDRLEGDFLLRLLYLHPARVTDRLCGVLSDCRHLARCIEMPLQHISDSVLLRMGRKIGEAETRKAVEMISRSGCAIRTTFMLGFPGETAEDFRKLYDFTEEQRFARMGAFVYSPEQGTPAAGMPDQVPVLTAKRRYGKLMRLQQEISYEANKAMVGGLVKVIFDQSPARGKAMARTVFDAPDIDNEVSVSKCPAWIEPGAIAEVLVKDADAYGLKAVFHQGGKA